MSESNLLLGWIIDDLPKEDGIVETETKLDRVNLVLSLVLRESNLVGKFLTNELSFLIVFPCFIPVDDFESLILEIFESESFRRIIKFLRKIRVLTFLLLFSQEFLRQNVPVVNIIVVFVRLLRHVSVDVCLHLQEKNKGERSCSCLDAKFLEAVYLFLALVAEVIDQSISVLLHAEFLVVELGLGFKEIDGLDGMSHLLQLTLVGARDQVNLDLAEDASFRQTIKHILQFFLTVILISLRQIFLVSQLVFYSVLINVSLVLFLGLRFLFFFTGLLSSGLFASLSILFFHLQL